MDKRKEAKKQLKKKDKEWADEIKKDKGCIICGSKIRLNAHHIIPREIKDTRHDLLNGIPLCPKHHKFGMLSAHRNPAWFILFLMNARPEIYNYIKNKEEVWDKQK